MSITFTATDHASGIAKIEFRTNGGVWKTYSGEPELVLAKDTHKVEFRSTDVAGNQEKAWLADFDGGKIWQP
ncbi:hypothetical protein MO973_43850 [Paenibacillus sp. TRM 82003]|nr:hypothetical protein [Paenibacillus sp. TRM 82003]